MEYALDMEFISFAKAGAVNHDIPATITLVLNRDISENIIKKTISVSKLRNI